MGKETPLSPALGGGGGGDRRDDTGGQLLRELEALNQVLHNAGQPNGRPLRKETPSSPFLGSVPAPRRSQETHSPLLRARSETQPEALPSSLMTSYASLRTRDSRSGEQLPSPYLGGRMSGAHAPPLSLSGGLDKPQIEPRSPVTVSLNGGNAPSFGRSGSRREGGSRPPLGDPMSPFMVARRSVDSAPSARSQLLRLSDDNTPRSPLSIGGQFSNGLSSPSLRARRSEGVPSRTGGVAVEPQSSLGRIEETKGSSYEKDQGGVVHLSRGIVPQSPRFGSARAVSESQTTARSLGSLNITELTLATAAAAMKSPLQGAPPNSRLSPLSQSEDPGKRTEAYRLDSGRESLRDRGIQAGQTQVVEKTLPEVSNYTAWLEDNIQFSKQLEAPTEKKSLWNWKPFRAIARIGQQRFHCMFTVHVHGIEGLPAVMNGLRLAVSWKRKDLHTQCMPSRVFQGAARFEETLHLKSTVYGTKNGSKGMKFETKSFDLAVIALDVDELVLGKHRLDLSRLLPNTVEVRDEENDPSWTARFKLSGKAKGGTLVVTFGYQLLNKNAEPTNSLLSARFGESPMVKPMRSYNSLPSSPNNRRRGAWPSGVVDSPYSPAMSDPPNESEYMKMEHLSLNDEYSSISSDNAHGHARASFGKNAQKDLFWPSIEFQGNSKIPYHDPPEVTRTESGVLTRNSYEESFKTTHAESEVLTKKPSEKLYNTTRNESEVLTRKSSDKLYAKARYDDEPLTRKCSEEFLEEDDGPEFTVVYQGHEISSIVDTAALVPDCDDPNAEADIVQGLSDGDTDARDPMQDPTVAEAPVDFDALDKVKVLSIDSNSKTMLAEPSDKVSARALEPASDGKSPLRGRGSASERSAVSGGDGVGDGNKLKYQSAVRQEPRKISKPQEQEIEIVEVPEDWSLGIQDELEDRDESKLVDKPASNIEGNLIRREDCLLDGKGDKKCISAAVGRKGNESTVDVAIVNNHVDEIERKRRTKVMGRHDEDKEKIINVIDTVKSTVREDERVETVQSTTPWPQLKMKQECEDDYDLVAGEFLRLLKGDGSYAVTPSESGDDLPRAALLQHFGKEAPIRDSVDSNSNVPEYAKFRLKRAQEEPPLVSDNIGIPAWDDECDDEFTAIMVAAEAELQKATQLLQSKARAKMLEDEETKALMQDWGLNDNAFDRPQPTPDNSLAIVPVSPAPISKNGLYSRGGGSRGSLRSLEGRGAGGRLLLQGPNPVATPSEKGMQRRVSVSGIKGLPF